VIFFSNIIETPKSSRDRGEKKREKEKEKEKLQKSLQIKGKLTFWEEKYALSSKILFYMISFSPPPSYYFKNLFQIIEKIFLTRLDHPLAWQHTWLELYPWAPYIQPIEGRMRRNNSWAKVRNHIPKRVLECPMLRNHNIIFSLIDFEKRISRRDTDERLYLSTAQDKVKNSTKAPWGE
jgi:hypothetical protein